MQVCLTVEHVLQEVLYPPVWVDIHIGPVSWLGWRGLFLWRFDLPE